MAGWCAVTLLDLEQYFDLVPRAAAVVEEVGPFTVFVAEPTSRLVYYARPSLGEQTFTSHDVRRVLAHQHAHGLRMSIEWVDEVTPALLPAVRGAVGGLAHELQQCPLLVLPEDAPVDADNAEEITADHPDLPWVGGTIHAGFTDTDDVAPEQPGARRELIRRGALVVVAVRDEDGKVVGGGFAAPRGETAELAGIAVLPGVRRRGVGTEVTRSLVTAVRQRGVRRIFLSAASDDAAAVYRRIGFERVGTACILGVRDLMPIA